MAQKVSVLLVDDLDGSEAAETVSFAIDGVNYEIDLSTENAQRLRNSLSAYVGSGRKQGTAKRRPATRGSGRQSAAASSAGSVDTNSVREWARENGYQVADRGRIRSDVIAAYQAATR